MTEPRRSAQAAGPPLPPRARLALAVAVAVLAAAAIVLLAARPPVSGQAGATGPGQGARDVSVEQALATPEPPLPVGMPTGRPARLGAPLDPLSPAEVGYARALAHEDAGGKGERVDGTPGLQFLSIDLAETAGATARRAALVTSYDYATDELVTQTVDLRAATVATRRASGIQPPPSRRESDVAMALLLADPASQALKQAVRATTRVRLTSPDQLEYAAGTWTARGATGPKRCGRHRCVLFQVSTADGRGLVLADLVVDLSAREVLEVTR